MLSSKAEWLGEIHLYIGAILFGALAILVGVSRFSSLRRRFSARELGVALFVVLLPSAPFFLSGFILTRSPPSPHEGLSHFPPEMMAQIKVSSSTPNSTCLACHGSTEKYLREDQHQDRDLLQMLATNEMTCLECHEKAHTRGLNSPRGLGE